jgi:hypothetical protein
LRNGFQRALHKRPVPTEFVDQAVDRIVALVLSLGEREIPSRMIGEMVMQELHKLDKVGYIRFASVYRAFQDVSDFRDGEISVRFEGISGRIDQGAGILFNLKPNGDYLTVRANPLENNLVLWKFEKGKRSSVKWIRDTPTPTRQWHDLKVRIAGTKVEGYLDGKLYLEHVLPQPVTGRIGLWSKADSHMYFDDYTVTPSD